MYVVAIKPLDVIVDKWKRRASIAGPDYEAGVRAPKEDWATATAGAEDAWEGGVQAAVAEKRFMKGATKAGTAKWQRKAIELGVKRYPEGVNVAVDDYKAGFGPFAEEISKVTLPERGPKGDPRNIERVKVIADALHKKKLELLK